MSIYCVYLTTYFGKKMPMFYVGSSTVKKINNGYKGSVSSKEYGKIWKEELRNSPELFKTKIISLHETREEAFNKEEKLQKQLNVVKNDLYVNKSFANSKFSLKQHSSWTRNKFKSRIPWNKGKQGIYSEQTLRKMGNSKRGRTRPHSDTTKIKLSGPNPLKANNGSRNGMFNKTHTDKVKTKLSIEASKRFKGKSYEELYGVKTANELKEKRSRVMKGKDNSYKNNPMFDNNLYTFYHVSTGELLYCTRWTLMKVYNINKTSMSDIINHGRICKNWCILYS